MPAGPPESDPDEPTLKEKVRRLPERPGVYLMKDRLGRILYVGKAKSLRKRVASYFQPARSFTEQPKIRALVGLIADFETIEVRSEPEALLLEGKLIKQWRPRYNTDFTDDKRFLLVRVDLGEELPRFRLTRIRKDDRSRYFGPFAHSGPLRRTLLQMRRQFGILLWDAAPQRQADGSWLLYDDVRAELYGQGNAVRGDDYRTRVEAACRFLEGKSREWLDSLRAEMARASAEHRFEKAAELRDAVFALEKTLEPARRFERTGPAVGAAVDAAVGLPAGSRSGAGGGRGSRGSGTRGGGEPGGMAGEGAAAAGEALQLLAQALALPEPPETLECFDISHISGTFVVASLVRFTGGRPDKDQYRRFRIRSFVGNDDYRAMEEVVGRRYRRLKEEGKLLPDLIVIDGGRGQVGAALKAFFTLDLSPPAIIGLAKREETIIFPDGRAPLNLPVAHPGLRLLQRLRDEAHRFANTYNADLRSRKIRESVLDDVPGLGPVRRAALLAAFGTIEKIRAAPVEALAGVPGIGPRLAADIRRIVSPA